MDHHHINGWPHWLPNKEDVLGGLSIKSMHCICSARPNLWVTRFFALKKIEEDTAKSCPTLPPTCPTSWGDISPNILGKKILVSNYILASHAAIYLSADNYLEIGQPPPLLHSHRCLQTIQTSCGIQSLFICARCVCSVPPSRVSNLYVMQLLDVKTDIEEFRRYMGFSAVRGICWLLLSDRPISWRELNVLQSYAPTGRAGKSNIAEFEKFSTNGNLQMSQKHGLPIVPNPLCPTDSWNYY